MPHGSTTTGSAVLGRSNVTVLTDGATTRRLDPASTAWRLVDGDVLGLDLQTEEYFVIKGSGVALWHRMADGATDEELAGVLTERYDLPLERARTDVAAFLDTLRKRGFAAP